MSLLELATAVAIFAVTSSGMLLQPQNRPSLKGHRARWVGDPDEDSSQRMIHAYQEARKAMPKGWTETQVFEGDVPLDHPEMGHLASKKIYELTLNSSVDDATWFREEYSQDTDNSLLNLTLSVPDTLPTEEQLQEQEAKEQDAIEATKPKILAEDAEASNYYRRVYVWDSGNDLEDFTRHRNWTRANAVSETALDSSSSNLTINFTAIAEMPAW
uniref:Uncharacterized protein n=1 Tax=Alexandrium monilatum TaxID=311494 RepID=A0A7S4QSK0_9DINO